MIMYLKKYFHPTQAEAGLSLAISYGKNGARLSHDHERQYCYVYQSLMLWREVAHEMFRLWFLAEKDLLSTTSPYRLRDTGQGLNRIQDVSVASSATMLRARAVLHAVHSGDVRVHARVHVCVRACVCVCPQSPHVGRAMHDILHRAQKMTGYWVGSSVIHLGDHNVPNRCALAGCLLVFREF
jgi:hypothetical protein